MSYMKVKILYKEGPDDFGASVALLHDSELGLILSVMEENQAYDELESIGMVVNVEQLRELLDAAEKSEKNN